MLPWLGAAPSTDIQTVNFLRNGSAEHCCQQCQTFVKLQLDESKDVFVAHTSLGWQSLTCRKFLSTKQTLFDNFFQED